MHKRFCFLLFAAISMGMVLPFPRNSFAGPGIPSTIRDVYVIAHSHLDIGYTAPPYNVELISSNNIQAQINYALSRPDYRWSIESTWMLSEYMKRKTPAQIEQLMQLVRSGRFSIAGGHSTLRSQKLGVEEMNRFLWHAQEWRNQYGISVDTVFANDVPSAQWSYPQVLAKSGIKYVISGQNLFIGGGISQPWDSYIFWWEGPDGSRILTWSARKGYVEAFATNKPETGWGIPWGSGTAIDTTRLGDSMSRLTDAGYPYDAVMVQYAFDNAQSTRAYDAIKNWNAANDNPKFHLATPNQFFEYMLETYGDQIPVRTGNWISNWDTLSMTQPQGEKIAKNSQHLLPAAEKMWTAADALGLGSYPHAQFDNAWDKTLVIDEHTGPGVHNGTAPQITQSINQYWAYATSGRDSTSSVLHSGAAALLGATAIPAGDTISVFNPLSWKRTDLVRMKLSSSRFLANFSLIDAITSKSVPYSKDSATSELLFVAHDVPPVGFKRFVISNTAPPTVSTSLAAMPGSIESARYRIAMNHFGYLTGIFDKALGRELIDLADDDDFNRLCPAESLEGFYGIHHDQPEPATSGTLSASLLGPVAATLGVEIANFPLASAKVTIYEELDRIDLVDRVNRDAMQTSASYYSVSFPFDMPGAAARIETPAGWWDPGDPAQLLPGSYNRGFGPQHCLDMSQTAFGLTYSTPDVYIHGLGEPQTPSGIYPPADPTIFSVFVRKDGASDEQGDGPEWDMRFSFRPHAGPFDPVREARFGWEVCTPLQAMEVAAAGGAPLTGNAMSFFSVDKPNVVITTVKEASLGPGMIVRLQEISGSDNTLVSLSSDIFDFQMVTETTPLEEDVRVLSRVLPGQGTPPRNIRISLDHNEILSLRIDTDFRTAVPRGIWPAYD